MGFNHRVNYGDNQSPFGILFSKAFAYVFQREYRFLWIAEQPMVIENLDEIINDNQDKLKSILPKEVELTLGSLKDIASIKYKKS